MQNKQKEFSTCLEDSAFAENLLHSMDQQGINPQYNSIPEETAKSLTNTNPITVDNKIMALILKHHSCADCPIRRRAMTKPYSLFAPIHRWHKTWWPGWKIYQAELHACRLKTPTVSNNVITGEFVK